MPIYPPTYIRIKQAVDHLKREKKILQKDIATRMGITEVSFSRAMDRLKSKNDDDFVIKFQSATKIFTLEWLLYGKEPKFTKDLKIENRATDIRQTVFDLQPRIEGMLAEDDMPLQLPRWAETLVSILSKQIAENEYLHAELKQSIQQVNDLKMELQSLINNKL